MNVSTDPKKTETMRQLSGQKGDQLQGLILDDSAVDRQRIRRLCRQAEIDVAFAEVGTIAEFASKIDAKSFDLFFLDYRLVQGDGLIALEMLKRHPSQRKAATIMVAGESQIQVAIDAMKNGCADFLLKDMMGPEMLSRSVAHAFASSAASRSQDDTHSTSVEQALARFASHSGAEMRSILSAMLRRTRILRHAAASGSAVSPEDVGQLDANCARLWEFLEEYQAFVSDMAPARPRPN